ncbi:hypothetical protein Cgig2_020155 [Carnegiea gigantea]|uniref:Ketoreductase domain-containing protein n=1 Tax=Carnegiea gigantea TaxID=171969 RepID=A0A9Q1KVW7_9CARY|nr:hypothetical protein Cgig2_020155 [Carnegiea gigantea]
MIFLIPLLFITILILNDLFKFATGDADLTLMSKKRVKREEVEDKVFWITGASRGIGEVLAKQLASLGAKLILSARNEADLQRVKSQLTGKYAPAEVKILPLDLASGEDSLREAVERAESFFSGYGVDYMIHNAAYERPKSAALEVGEESLKAIFNVNVFGTVSLTRLLAPYMVKRGKGHFVVMSSAAGKTPAPGQAVYSASKFALNGYFHSLRSEVIVEFCLISSLRILCLSTAVCIALSERNQGPIEATKSSDAGISAQTRSSEKRLSAERCAQLIIIAASHGLKEAWISYQPVLAVMYLVQYMPTIGFWLMDKIGEKRVDAAAEKKNTYSLGLLFGKQKKT